MTRRNFIGSSSAAFAAGAGVLPAFPSGGARAIPTAAQKSWQDMELGMFFHYDIPVFKPDWNWRSFKNHPDPSLYSPAKLDTDQWMEAAKAYGAKYVVFVAKHCSGFLQWQSDLYPYGLRQSSWRGGKGDVVRDFVESARRCGLKPGLYASVATNSFLGVLNPGIVKKNAWLGKPSPEAQKRYVRICERMAEELWSRYGELAEIWFDGGALPPEKGGPDLMPLIEKLQPNAILFQGPANARNLIRWIGNERGIAPYPCWSTGREVTQSDGTRESRNERNTGNPDGDRWMPGECDVPLKERGWFCTDRGRYWTMDELMEIYFSSVGRNCNLLLNAAPQPDGLVAEEEMRIYKEFGRRIKGIYTNRLCATEGEGDRIELAVPEDSGPVDQVVLMERIERGERVRDFALDALVGGEWREIYRGSCIGHKHIARFDGIAASRLRLSVRESSATPLIRDFSAYRRPAAKFRQPQHGRGDLWYNTDV